MAEHKGVSWNEKTELFFIFFLMKGEENSKKIERIYKRG